jgi:hypothetical protein
MAGGSKPAETAIACRADALDRAQRRRQQELLQAVRTSALGLQELPDGYAVRLAADPAQFQLAAEWIALERRCCPFLEFALEWRQDDSVWVRLTGGAGVKEFLAETLPGEAPAAP